MQPLRERMRSLRASPVFSLYVLVALALSGLNALMVAMMASGLNFLLPGPFAQMTHFTLADHGAHDLTFGLLFGIAGLGLIVQLWQPMKHVAGILLAIIPFAALLLAAAFSDARVIVANPARWVAPIAVVAAFLHPAGRAFFRSFSVSRTNWVMVALVAVAAVPLLLLAATNLGSQTTLRDDHAAMGHYGFMAGASFTVIGVGLLASLRPEGWRLVAWTAGILPALLGVTSIAYPNASSSLDMVWARAAIAWGAIFVITAEITKRTSSTADVRAQPAAVAPARKPRWVNIVAVVALAVLVALGPLSVLGGLGGQHGPSLHGTPSDGGNDAPSSGAGSNARGVGGPASADQATRTVNVTTGDNLFEPSSMTLARGETVTFIVTNTGQADHEFVLGDAATQQQRAQMRSHMGSTTPHDMPNAIHVAPGETRQLTWRFGDTPLEYVCHEPGHYDAGMRGEITIA